MTCVLLVAAVTLAASQPHARFRHLGLAEGLSNGTVNKMVQDRDGFIWFATDDGLNKYDGYGFTVFRHRPGDSSSLAENYVSSICTDRAGELWVETGGVIQRFDHATGTFVREETLMARLQAVGRRFVTRMLFDRDGILWLGTAGKGLYHYDPRSGNFGRFPVELTDGGSVDDALVNTICVDSTNRVWVGTAGSGLAVIAPERSSAARYTRVPGDTVDLHRVSALTADPHGNVWVATRDGALCRFDRGLQHIAAVHPYERRLIVWAMSLLFDTQGTLWIGTFGGGIRSYEPRSGTSRRYTWNRYDGASAPGDRIYSILEDRAGSVWFGTWKDGIGVWHPRAAKVEHVTHAWYDSTSLSDPTVWSICQDRTGALWVGTEQGGLNRADGSSRGFTHYLHRAGDPTSLSGNSVKAICEDSSGTLWIGTMDDGLNRYDRARNAFVRYRHRPSDPGSLANDRVTALAVDREGQLWVGGSFLDRYDPGANRFVHYDASMLGEDLWKNTEVQSMTEDHDGNLWIGAFPAGLLRLKKSTGALRRYGYPDPVYHLHVDAGGTLWVGCFARGLFRYDAVADTFTNYSTLDGLPSNFVKSIQSDDHGKLWLGTSNGLSRFDPAARTARNYDPADGVQGYEFRTGSCFRARDGKLYFGGINGYNAFYPDSVRDNLTLAPLLVTSLKVFDTPVPLAAADPKEITLPPGADFITFEFVALDYAAPAKIRYAYMMEGLDSRWVVAGTRRYASYAHLEPGEYVFRVKGTNSDGVWNEEGASVRLVIQPPFWKAFWFRALLTLLVAGLVYAIYRYRLGRLLEVERTRAAIATDLHDDIGTSLTNIALSSDLARREIAAGTHGVTQRLEKISETSRSLLDAMNDIVWSIKPDNDALEKTILHMEDYAVAVLADGGIDLHVGMTERLKTLRLPMAVRRHLFLIFKELIANIVKHSGASRVEMTVAAEGPGRHPQLQLTIADDGRGFETASVRGGGNGLANIASRVRQMDGNLTVRSAPGQGTRVEIRFPLRSPR